MPNNQRHRAAGDDALNGFQPDWPLRCRRWLHTIRVPLATGRCPLGVHLFHRAHRPARCTGTSSPWDARAAGLAIQSCRPLWRFARPARRDFVRQQRVASVVTRDSSRGTAPGTRAGCRCPGTRDETHVTVRPRIPARVAAALGREMNLALRPPIGPPHAITTHASQKPSGYGFDEMCAKTLYNRPGLYDPQCI